MRFSTPLLFLLALALPAQTLVEYSLGTASAAGAAASMQGIGKATAALLDKTAKALETAPKPAGAPAAIVKLSPPPDPAAVKIGMDSQEVVARFGKPALETWSYGSPPDELILTLRDGKVSAVSRPKELRDQTVVIVQ